MRPTEILTSPSPASNRSGPLLTSPVSSRRRPLSLTVVTPTAGEEPQTAQTARKLCNRMSSDAEPVSCDAKIRISLASALQSPQLNCESPDKENTVVTRKTRRVTTPMFLRTPSETSTPRVLRDLECVGTPEPPRADLKAVKGEVRVVYFDFDGTLTATPGPACGGGGVGGGHAARASSELCERKRLLEPFLEALCSEEGGCALGIISKSTKNTIQRALREAGLEKYFKAPLVDKAVGFEGKAGFLEDLISESQSTSFPADKMHQVLLVDDDLRELARASAKGAQTFPAPPEGGLQKVDLVELLSLALGQTAPVLAGA